MEIKLLNQTDYANIYGIGDGEKCIGTAEVRLAGRDVGIYFYTWDGRYTRKDIERIFLAERLKERR